MLDVADILDRQGEVSSAEHGEGRAELEVFAGSHLVQHEQRPESAHRLVDLVGERLVVLLLRGGVLGPPPPRAPELLASSPLGCHSGKIERM